MQPRTHHRAVALLVTIALAIGLTKLRPPRTITVAPAPVARRELEPRSIDPRTASAREFEALPGVGPSIARRIVEARARGARFERPSDLARVRGIGPRTVERIAPYLTFTDRRGAPPPRSP